MAESDIGTLRIPSLGDGVQPSNPFSSSMRLKRAPPAASAFQRTDPASEGRVLERCLVRRPLSGGAERYSGPTVTC